MTIHELSQYNQQIAWQIIESTQIIHIWENRGAEVHLVGSLKSGLLMKSIDIDLHVYTEELTVADSFATISKIAQNPAIKEIQYRNLIDTDEACIEWHMKYEDEKNNKGKIDLIHILKGSTYDGVVEKVTDAIIKQLTPEIKETILQIKYDIPDKASIPGIEIYRAVLSGGVRSYSEFKDWHQANPISNTLDWIPG